MALKKKSILGKYIEVIKDMHDDRVTSMRTIWEWEDTSAVTITVVLH